MFMRRNHEASLWDSEYEIALLIVIFICLFLGSNILYW